MNWIIGRASRKLFLVRRVVDSPPTPLMDEQSRPTHVEVNLRAILNNYHRLREQFGPDVAVMGVVKADAYGHGAVPVARTLVGAGAEWLGVARLEEAVELRMSGIQAPILLLGGVELEEAEAAREFRIHVAACSAEMIAFLNEEGRKWNRPVQIHLKIDTGMHRLGIGMDELEPLLDQLVACEGVEVDGVMSHFASAEEPAGELTRLQLERFSEAAALCEAKLGRRLLRHLCNSAGALLIPAARHDLVRPGIMLYGAHMTDATRTLVQLEPAFTWKARIRQVKAVKAGETVGYGGTWTASQDSRIAVLAAGYADGFSRALSNRGYVAVAGRRAPLAGRVSMDLVAVDVTGIPEARPGLEAVLIGRDGEVSVTVEEWAGWLGTIPYEIFCNVSRRVARVHTGMAR